MNRLVRISFTLFASATILIFLVVQRLESAKGLVGSTAEAEIRMAWFGAAIVGVMLLGGIALVVTAILRSRRKTGGHE